MIIGLVHYTARALERLSNRSSIVATKPNNSIGVDTAVSSKINSTKPTARFWRDIKPYLNEATIDLKQAAAKAASPEEFQVHLHRFSESDGFRPAYVFHADRIDPKILKEISEKFFRGNFWTIGLYEELMNLLKNYKGGDRNKRLGNLANELREADTQKECVEKLTKIGFTNVQIDLIAQLPGANCYEKRIKGQSYVVGMEEARKIAFEKAGFKFWQSKIDDEFFQKAQNEFFKGNFWTIDLYKGLMEYLKKWEEGGINVQLPKLAKELRGTDTQKECVEKLTEIGAYRKFVDLK